MIRRLLLSVSLLVATEATAQPGREGPGREAQPGREALHAEVERQLPTVQPCYRLEANLEDGRQRRVTLEFVITTTGAVRDARVVESSAQSADVGTCIATQVGRWQFTPPAARGVQGEPRVRYPFLFRGEPAAPPPRPNTPGTDDTPPVDIRIDVETEVEIEILGPDDTPSDSAPGDPQAESADSASDEDRADESENNDETAREDSALPEEARPRVESHIEVAGEDEGDGIATGDLFTLVVRANARAIDDVTVPREQDLASFEVLDRRAREEPQGDRRLHVFELDLLALEPGEHEIPGVQIRVVTPAGDLGEVRAPTQNVTVDSVLGNEPDAQPRPPTEPVQVFEEDHTLYWILGALGVVLLTAILTLLGARWWRRRERAAAPPPPPRPAWEIALGKLDALRRNRETMLADGEGVRWVDGVSDAVREYLGNRYEFDGLESTSDEVVQLLSRRKAARLNVDEVRALLGDCDLVKFAKASLTEEQASALLDGAYRVVQTTSPTRQAGMPQEPARRNVENVPPPADAAQESPPQGDARWKPPIVEGPPPAVGERPKPEAMRPAPKGDGVSPPATRPTPTVSQSDVTAIPATRPTPTVSQSDVTAIPATRPMEVVSTADAAPTPATRPREAVSEADGAPIPVTGPMEAEAASEDEAAPIPATRPMQSATETDATPRDPSPSPPSTPPDPAPPHRPAPTVRGSEPGDPAAPPGGEGGNVTEVGIPGLPSAEELRAGRLRERHGDGRDDEGRS